MLLPSFNQNFHYKPTINPTIPIRNKELDETRAEGLCFWCDEKFVPKYKCKNKRLYSPCIVEDEDDEVKDNNGFKKKTFSPEQITPHISINTLEVAISFLTPKVTGQIDKHPLFILVNLGSTHNFINIYLANKLQCDLIAIKPLTMEAINRGIMLCTTVCKDFKWKIQRVNFMVDEFTVKLNNYDMILGI
jgi:hypothetical protein